MYKKPAKLLSTSNHLLIILFIKKRDKIQKKLKQIKRNELYAMWWVVTYK